MDVVAFQTYLKKTRRSPNAIKQILTIVSQFELYLERTQRHLLLENIKSQHIRSYVKSLESKGTKNTAKHLWGLRYYYQFIKNPKITALIAQLREQRIKRTPFLIKDFRGIPPAYIKILKQHGVINITQMLKEGKTTQSRQKLSEATQIPYTMILELTKLSDLARIPGIKGIRARLYYDAGEDTLSKLAQQSPQDLQNKLIKFVKETNFDGIAPLPREIEYTIKQAQRLSSLVNYDG